MKLVLFLFNSRMRIMGISPRHVFLRNTTASSLSVPSHSCFLACGFSAAKTPCFGDFASKKQHLVVFSRSRNSLHFVLKDNLYFHGLSFLFLLCLADYGVLPTKHFFKMLRVHQSSRIVVDCHSLVSLRQLLALSTSFLKTTLSCF